MVLGGSGLLGARLVEMCLERKFDVSYTYNRNKLEVDGADAVRLDAMDYDAVGRAVADSEADLVVDTIAHPSVDFCETDKVAAYGINVASCEAAALAARELGAKLVFISSTFVFGNREKPVTENDTPDPINYYGALKLLGEEAAKICPDHLILRTDQIYGWSHEGQKKSFVESMLEKFAKGGKIEVCRDWYNRPTHVDDLALALIKLVEKEKRGVYHCVGGTFLSRVEWAKRIAKAFGEDDSLIVPIDSATLKLPARRPKCDASNAKLEKECGLKMRGVDSAMKEMAESRP